jgi:hypothetical protein
MFDASFALAFKTALVFVFTELICIKDTKKAFANVPYDRVD